MTIRIAVLVPCCNEEAAIGRVVRDFRAALPDATVYVYDNGSSDRTGDCAREAGAEVRIEPLRGKGNVVRRMFADIDADVYVLVDGDATYDAASGPRLIETLRSGAFDMVTGRRVHENPAAYPRGHQFGNSILTSIVVRIFGGRINDMLSGYRVLSRRFVKSFPALATGFEIETELTVHALELRMPITELDAPYNPRSTGSQSKLSTFRDGWRVLLMVLVLVKEERPMSFFGLMALILFASGLLLAWPLLKTYLESGLVPRLPTALLSTALVLLAFLLLVCGLVLDTVTRGRREMKRMHYLSIAGPRRSDVPQQNDGRSN